MIRFVFIITAIASCSSINENLRFRKDEFETFTTKYSYRVLKEQQLKEYITGGLEEPSIDCELGNFSKSLNYFRQYYSRHNRKPAYWVKAAVCALRENNEELSLFLFKKAQLKFQDEPSSALAINLAVYFHQLKNYSLAYEQYLRAQELESENLLLKVNFSRLLLKIGYLNEALELLTSIYAVASFDNEVLHLLGTALLLTERYELAIKTYQKIIGPDIRRRDIAINYALSHYYNGSKSEALSILENSDKSLNPAVEKRHALLIGKIKS